MLKKEPIALTSEAETLIAEFAEKLKNIAPSGKVPTTWKIYLNKSLEHQPGKIGRKRDPGKAEQIIALIALFDDRQNRRSGRWRIGPANSQKIPINEIAKAAGASTRTVKRLIDKKIKLSRWDELTKDEKSQLIGGYLRAIDLSWDED